MNEIKLSKLDKLELVGLCIEGATGVIGVSVILTETHPYASIAVLAVGAIATKIVAYINKKENEIKNDNKAPN